MKTLRQLHLYSGCIFAPLLIFFALSGIWQTLENSGMLSSRLPQPFRVLSTLHISKPPKVGPSMSSPAMSILAIAMSVSLVFTLVLGVMIAFKMGHRKAALSCLVIGIITPAAFAVLAYR